MNWILISWSIGSGHAASQLHFLTRNRTLEWVNDRSISLSYNRPVTRLNLKPIDSTSAKFGGYVIYQMTRMIVGVKEKEIIDIIIIGH